MALDELAARPNTRTTSLLRKLCARLEKASAQVNISDNPFVAYMQRNQKEESNVQLAKLSPFERMDHCRKCLVKLDNQGWSRSYHQRQFHEDFLRACCKSFWKLERSGQFARDHGRILVQNNWDHLSQEILISTPRRFGKTISVSMFAAAMIVSCPGLECSIYSTCKRISQKLLRNIQKFIMLACEQNLENQQLRTIRQNMEEVVLQGPAGPQDVRVVNSYPSKVTPDHAKVCFVHLFISKSQLARLCVKPRVQPHRYICYIQAMLKSPVHLYVLICVLCIVVAALIAQVCFIKHIFPIQPSVKVKEVKRNTSTWPTVVPLSAMLIEFPSNYSTIPEQALALPALPKQSSHNKQADKLWQKQYYQTHRNVFNNKADFPAIKHLVERSGLCASNNPILIGGVNEGQFLLQVVQLCPNATIHGFEIQPSIFKTTQAKVQNLTNVHLHNKGWGERSQSGLQIGGSGGTAGLYQTKGTRFDDWGMQDVTSSTVALSEWCTERGIGTTSYVVIDVEGYEPKVLRGMKLDRIENQKRFPHIQFELGGTWARLDPRHGGENEWSQFQAARFMQSWNYRLFLIGMERWMEVSAEFFEPGPHMLEERNNGKFVQGNLLCLHNEYSLPPIMKTVTS